MSESNDVARRITLAPDPRLVRSLGANHTLESAIADLVDNSIDAGASTVWVRLLTNDGRLVQVEVHDNGSGMDERTIDDAMTIGHQREYNAADLGHFGMGLKQAAFGNCDVLGELDPAARWPPDQTRRLLDRLRLRSTDRGLRCPPHARTQNAHRH